MAFVASVFKTTILVEDVLFYIFVTKIFLFLAGSEFYNLLRYIFKKKCVISCVTIFLNFMSHQKFIIQVT